MMPVPGSWRKLASQPRQPLGLAGQVDHVEAQPVAAQRASKREEAGPSWAATSSTTLSLAVAVHPRTGHGGGQVVEDPGHPPVVGPEVVAPVGDAVDLVDDDQARSTGDDRRPPGEELGVGQSLGRHEEEIDLVGLHPVGDLGPVLLVARVDGRGLDAEPLSGLQLVAHERQQRRDEQRRPETLTAEEMGGEEVDGALAPPGPLHEQHPPALVDQGRDRLPLTGTELGGRVAREQPQAIKQKVALATHRHAEEYGAGVRRSAGVMPTGCWRSRELCNTPWS